MEQPTGNEYIDAVYSEAVNHGQQQDPNSLYADMMREEQVRNIISQINPDLLLEDIEHRLRGEIKDRFTKEWRPITKNNKPVNETLINNYIGFLGSILTNSTTLSNFSRTEINNLMGMIAEHLRDDLPDNEDIYGFVKTRTIIIKQEKKILYPIINSDGMISYMAKPIIQEVEIEMDKTIDYNEMNRVANIICMASFAVFKRAENGMEARRLFNSLKLSETNQGTGNQKKQWYDFLKFGA